MNQIKNCRRKKTGNSFVHLGGEQLSSKKAAFFKKTAVFFKNDEGKLLDPATNRQLILQQRIWCLHSGIKKNDGAWFHWAAWASEASG